jgi:AraC-like DNA-binding protein
MTDTLSNTSGVESGKGAFHYASAIRALVVGLGSTSEVRVMLIDSFTHQLVDYQQQAALLPLPPSRLRQSARATLRQQICAFVARNLDNSDLSVATVADALGCTKRHAHRLFCGNGITLRDYINEQRLQRCQADLADPRNDHLSITHIALGWGYSSSAYFSSAFRRRFGVAPRSYRAQALANRAGCSVSNRSLLHRTCT